MTYQEQHARIAALRDKAAKEGHLLPPLPSCRAPWCGCCGTYRTFWGKLLGEKIIIK